MDEHLFEDTRGLCRVRDIGALAAELRGSRGLAAFMAIHLVAAIQVRTRALAAILRVLSGEGRSECADAARRELAGLGRTLALIRSVHPDLVRAEAIDALLEGSS